MNRILICTYAAGYGHHKASEAIREALLAAGPETEVRIFDPLHHGRPYLSTLLVHGYLRLLKRAPWIYRNLYARAEAVKQEGRAGIGFGLLWKTVLNRTFWLRLDMFMQEFRPGAVICTHPFAAVAISAWKKRKQVKIPAITGVITDFTIHPFWPQSDLDGYFVSSPELAETMAETGVPGERIWVVGIPVGSRFGRTLNRNLIKLKLGLDPHKTTVLVTGGGLGLGGLKEAVEALGTLETPIQIMAVTGLNPVLQQSLERVIRDLGNPVKVFSFVDNMADLMRASDIIVSKPGGITVAEALVTGKPVVIWKPLPGQEERNSSFLVRHSLARLAGDLQSLAAVVKELAGQEVSIAGRGPAVLHASAARSIVGIVNKTYMD